MLRLSLSFSGRCSNDGATVAAYVLFNMYFLSGHFQTYGMGIAVNGIWKDITSSKTYVDFWASSRPSDVVPAPRPSPPVLLEPGTNSHLLLDC